MPPRDRWQHSTRKNSLPALASNTKCQSATLLQRMCASGPSLPRVDHQSGSTRIAIGPWQGPLLWRLLGTALKVGPPGAVTELPRQCQPAGPVPPRLRPLGLLSAGFKLGAGRLADRRPGGRTRTPPPIARSRAGPLPRPAGGITDGAGPPPDSDVLRPGPEAGGSSCCFQWSGTRTGV